MEFEGRSRLETQLDIAPLIDVVLLLLVFFLLTSTFFKREAIEVDLPEAASATRVHEHPIEVVLEHDGTVRLEGDAVTLEQLQTAIADRLATSADEHISVKADADASVRQMMDVIDHIRLGGGRNLAFATQPRTTEAKP